MDQEKLEQEAREFLAAQFVRTQDVEHVEDEGAPGTYVWFQFDTVRNPQGEGDFRLACVKVGDEWHIADYEALPMGGHRGIG